MIFLLKERDVKTITGWETLLHFSKEFDAEMLSDWKDELNNILIFVGFSYTIVSFSYLMMIVLVWSILRCSDRFCG